MYSTRDEWVVFCCRCVIIPRNHTEGLPISTGHYESANMEKSEQFRSLFRVKEVSSHENEAEEKTRLVSLLYMDEIKGWGRVKVIMVKKVASNELGRRILIVPTMKC